LAETVAAPELKRAARSGLPSVTDRHSSTSLLDLWTILQKNWRLFVSIVATLVAACLIYCLIAPKQFEASARVALRNAPDSALAIDRHDAAMSGAFATGQVQLETLANVLRSEQLAWDVITELRLYQQPGFSRHFSRRFPGFTPANASADAREYLLDEFREDLTVEGVPHTLVLAIRFRSHDAALSAAVVNALIQAYGQQETDTRLRATRNGTEWLDAQLHDLQERVDRDDVKLADFQKEHGILSTSQILEDGRSREVGHSGAVAAVDALSRELVNATADRILLQSEYSAAMAGDPEAALALNGRAGLAGAAGTALLQQLRARRSDLQQEKTQLEIEHGPNFPRVVEIRKQTQDLDEQIKAADAKLVEDLRSASKTSLEREHLLRKSLEDATGAGLEQSRAELKYIAMRQEVNANREVYVRIMQQAEEAGLAAGSHGSAMSVIDYARQPAKPASPNWPVDLPIALFVSLWVGLGAVLGREGIRNSRMQAATLMGFVVLGASLGHGQAPTPSTSGLPTGVARIPQSAETKSLPNAKDAPMVWSGGQGTKWTGTPPGNSQAVQVMAAPIGPGDMLEVTEAHSPEMRAAVRVSEAGAVILPLAGELQLGGMDERTAAHAIESALLQRGMLLHPQVTVLVTAYAGQDVSVLGEVARPGVYSYTVHHRLLDLISEASGLSQNAGRLVTVTHRNDPQGAVVVVLDSSGKDNEADHNPELLAGDTVQVSRSGLVYVVGDVIRPGGFPVDPVQTTTVLQAVSLAWGPAQNAALKKAVLIRAQAGGRTVTTLNLKRMLRGLDPDVPVRDRDILFVPDSMAKNLWNRSMESVIQSAAGVSIYSGLVYSQRF
jgi:polysaccharide biosynthesis/export protein